MHPFSCHMRFFVKLNLSSINADLNFTQWLMDRRLHVKLHLFHFVHGAQAGYQSESTETETHAENVARDTQPIREAMNKTNGMTPVV